MKVIGYLKLSAKLIERVNDMDKTFNVTIKFTDGEILEIAGAASYGIYSLDNDRYAYVDVNGRRNYFKHSTIKYIGWSRDFNRDDKTLIDIYVRDKSTGEIHRVGDNRHDSLDVVNGKVLYYNLQNGCGTPYLEYEFVNSDAGTLEE